VGSSSNVTQVAIYIHCVMLRGVFALKHLGMTHPRPFSRWKPLPHIVPMSFGMVTVPLFITEIATWVNVLKHA